MDAALPGSTTYQMRRPCPAFAPYELLERERCEAVVAMVGIGPHIADLQIFLGHEWEAGVARKKPRPMDGAAVVVHDQDPVIAVGEHPEVVHRRPDPERDERKPAGRHAAPIGVQMRRV